MKINRSAPFLLFVNLLFTCFIQGQTQIDSLKTIFEKTINKKEKLAVLDKLTKQMIRENHKELMPALKDYMNLASELKEHDLLASKSRFLIQQYLMKGKNEQAIQLCDSILLLKPYFKKVSSEAHIVLKRGGVYFSDLKYKKAIKDYQKSQALFLESKDSIFAADAYFFEGQAHSNSGDFIKAINKYEIATHLYEKLKDYSYMFYIAIEVDLIYRRNGLRDIANKKYPALVRKSRKYKAYDILQFLYASLTEEAIRDNELKKANKYLDSTTKYIAVIKEKTLIKPYIEYQTASLNLRLKLKENNIKAADSLYKQVLSLEKKVKHKKQKNSLRRDQINYLLKKNNINAALELLLKYRAYSKKSSDKNYNLLESEELLSRVYEQKGDYKKALQYKNNYLILKDSVRKESLTNAFAFHQTRFETAKKEKEIVKNEAAIKQLEADKQLENSKRNTLLAILFSIILISIGIWWKGKQKRKALKDKLERNKNELTDFTQQLLQKRFEQDTLKKELEALKDKVTEKESIASIQDLVTSKILTKDDWYNFKEKFTRVHPSFFTQIKEKGYKLTKSEERLVALEKLGLDNNEIANMLGVSIDSVFISRYRLRKKISAPKEIPLIEYFE